MVARTTPLCGNSLLRFLSLQDSAREWISWEEALNNPELLRPIILSRLVPRPYSHSNDDTLGSFPDRISNINYILRKLQPTYAEPTKRMATQNKKFQDLAGKDRNDPNKDDGEPDEDNESESAPKLKRTLFKAITRPEDPPEYAQIVRHSRCMQLNFNHTLSPLALGFVAPVPSVTSAPIISRISWNQVPYYMCLYPVDYILPPLPLWRHLVGALEGNDDEDGSAHVAVIVKAATPIETLR